MAATAALVPGYGWETPLARWDSNLLPYPPAPPSFTRPLACDVALVTAKVADSAHTSADTALLQTRLQAIAQCWAQRRLVLSLPSPPHDHHPGFVPHTRPPNPGLMMPLACRKLSFQSKTFERQAQEWKHFPK
ncbi:hypothetical protein HOO65_010671 [Ceratocystis lukuohia]|uniref:Uncharacterized protein n=1 Tax=Ceratocystis lukuohia TaxID=2019550 RepID=A0ABR4MSR7_9PEZI